MSELTRIKIGDFVDVHFIRSESIFKAKVAYVPQATGDSWILFTSEDKTIYVQLFERMDLLND